MQDSSNTSTTLPLICKYNSRNEPCGGFTSFKEATYGKSHDVFDGAPDQWAADRGATHTLWCGKGPGRGTRPAKLLKTRLHVGTDEVDDGSIVWEVWTGKQTLRWEDTGL